MSTKIGRNDTCPCGSGRKYKRCCLGNEQALHAGKQDQQAANVRLLLEGLAIETEGVRDTRLRSAIREMLLGRIFQLAIEDFFNPTSLGPFGEELWDEFLILDTLKQKAGFRESGGSPYEMEKVGLDLVNGFKFSELTIVSLRSSFSAKSDRKVLYETARKAGVGSDFLKSLGIDTEHQAYLCDESTDLRDSSRVSVINHYLYEKNDHPKQYAFAYVVDLGSMKLAVVDSDSWVPEYWCIPPVEAHKVARDISRFRQSIDQSGIWSRLIRVDPTSWYYEDRLVREKLKFSGYSATASQIAKQFANQLIDEAKGEAPLEAVLETLQHESGQDLFENLWNRMRELNGADQPRCPNGMQMVKALLEDLKPQEAKAFASRKRRSAPRKASIASAGKGLHRLKRSDFDPLTLNDIQIVKCLDALEGELKQQAKASGLRVAWPKLSVTNTCATVELDFDKNRVEIPRGFLSCSWEQLAELCRWILTSCVARDYERSRDGMSYQEAFELAARRLCLAVEFRNPDLERMPAHWKNTDNNLDDQQRKILRKVDKLFALAGSNHQAEAELAMQRAHDLLRSYNLASSNQAKSSYAKLTIEFGKARMTRVLGSISNILEQFYSVRVIHGYSWSIERSRYEANIEILGFKHNVLIAEHVFDFLTYKCETLWEQAKKDGMIARQKMSFQLGLLNGFGKALAKRGAEQRVKEMGSEDVEGLIALQERDLDQYVANLYPSLRSISRSAYRVDRGGYEAGKEAGANLKIDQALSQAKKNNSFAGFLG